MKVKIVRSIVSFLLVLAGSGAALGQSSSSSYLSPFPEGDQYKMLIVGDDFSYGLAGGLTEAFGTDSRLQIDRQPHHIEGLLRANIDREAAELERRLQAEKFGVAVVMAGARDRVGIRDSKGRRYRVGSDVWRKEYADRADQLMKVFKRNSVAAYWVGLPNVSRQSSSQINQMMNEILRERAYVNGIKFVDVYSGFSDESGGFSAYGPDLSGEMRLLRRGDGTFFTEAGNRKLAHFVERLLRRDLRQAKGNRQIPLAGNQEEQARIHPEKVAAKSGPGDGQAEAVAGDEDKGQPSGIRNPVGAGGELTEDHGRISLRLRSSAGAEDVVVLDIQRPAIPASVVSLITRRADPNRPADIGDTLVDNIPGGLTVMSSIAPSGAGQDGSRGVISPTQTPFFRVLVKGERVRPRRGRVDDFSWPKQTAVRNSGAAQLVPQEPDGNTEE